MSKPVLWDQGDYILKASLYCVGMWMQRKATDLESGRNMMLAIDEQYYDAIREIANTMIKECRLDKWWGHRKSDRYKWSNSGSQNPNDNTLWKRPTWWLYHNVLKYIGVDPYKGANHDQYRAYFIYLYLTQDRLGAAKVIWGYIWRAGLTPSLMEWAPFKPWAYIMLLATIWKPLNYLVRPLFKWRMRKNLAVPIPASTTNKISLLPTMELLDIGEKPTDQFIIDTYTEYWPKKGKADTQGHTLIREALIGALT